MAMLRAATLLAVLWHGCATPSVAPQWSGSFSAVSALGSVDLEVAFDLPNAHFDMNQAINMSGQQSMYLWNTSYGDDPSGFTWNITMNTSFCFPSKTPWSQVLHDFGFGWLAQASQQGNKTVAGKACQVWAHSEEKRYDWSACIDLDGIPREFSLKAYPEECGSSMASYFSFGATLKHVSLGKPATAALTPTDACASWPPPLCPFDGIKTMKVYRDTSFATPAPDNQNGGDAKGQCRTALMYQSKYVVVYDVTLNTSYSQYAMCNYIRNGDKGNVCIGGGKTVGRAPFARICEGKPQCGQCTPNEDIGSWVSFPREGECAAGEAVGTNGCTWNATLSKVLDYDCVMDNSTKAGCFASESECAILFEKGVERCPPVIPPTLLSGYSLVV